MQFLAENSPEQTEQNTKESLIQLDNLQADEFQPQQAQISTQNLEQFEQFEDKDSDSMENTLEKEFLGAIELIESQSSQMEGPKNEEIIFLLGNTGSGKSTLFNWLLGRNLVVKKDQKLKAANWIVEVDSDGSIEDQPIGHIQVSTTTIPKIAKSNNGPYLVDFPGWQDTRGWQYEFVNQLVTADLTGNCSKIKILFICDYNVFKTDRGTGIKQLVNNINSFAQGNSIHASAMLVITKLMLEDDPCNYIEDIRNHCRDVFDQSQLCDENKTIINSLMNNEIFIMEKASRCKSFYSEDERNSLWKMINNLQSSSIQLKVYVTNQINSEFTRYFNNEMKKIKAKVVSIISKIGDIQVKLVEEKNNETILQMHLIISQAKNDLFQNTQNQIHKYQALERLYKLIVDMLKEDPPINDRNYENFSKIYNHFFYLKQKIQAYSIEFINDVDFHNLFIIEQNLSQQLKIMHIIDQEQIDKEKDDYQKLLKEMMEQKRQLEQMQKEKNIEYNSMRRHIENAKRKWWFVWLKPRIPDWVQDVDEYIRLEG